MSTAQSANVDPALFKSLQSQRPPVNSKSIYPVQPRSQGSLLRRVGGNPGNRVVPCLKLFQRHVSADQRVPHREKKRAFVTESTNIFHE